MHDRQGGSAPGADHWGGDDRGRGRLGKLVGQGLLVLEVGRRVVAADAGPGQLARPAAAGPGPPGDGIERRVRAARGRLDYGRAMRLGLGLGLSLVLGPSQALEVLPVAALASGSYDAGADGSRSRWPHDRRGVLHHTTAEIRGTGSRGRLHAEADGPRLAERATGRQADRQTRRGATHRHPSLVKP